VTNSRAKGARGERQAAAAVASHLHCTASRGVQYQGGKDSPDIQTDLAGIHFEVKRCERGCVHSWMEQSKRDAGRHIPTVLHRKNNTEWLLTVRLEDMYALAKQLLEKAITAEASALVAGEVPADVSGEDLPASDG